MNRKTAPNKNSKYNMNKLTTLIICLLTSIQSFGQTNIDNSVETEEFSFFYKDSVDNIVSFGDIEPTGFVCLNSGSIIVSTKFSFEFPKQSQKKDSISEEEQQLYNEQKIKMDAKSHISSGSVFKLNSSFQKEWEIVFKDKRVEAIKKLPNQTIIIAGERINIRKFWMAQIDTTGKIIWQKEYKFKYSSRIADMVTDSLGYSYILLDASKILHVNLRNIFNKRRLHFYTLALENDIYIMKVNKHGNVLWTKCIDNQKKIDKFGNKLIINQNIFATTFYSGFFKTKDGLTTYQQKEKVIELNSKGKIINKSLNNNNFIYYHQNKFYSCKIEKDTLILNTYKTGIIIPTDTIIFTKNKLSWINSFFTTKNYIYLLDFYEGIIKLDKNNNFINHIETSGILIDGIQLPDHSILVLEECHIKDQDENNNFITYIKLTKIKNIDP